MERVVIVGMGQLGGVFARGFLSVGRIVVPILRSSDRIHIAEALPAPVLCLVSVAEPDLDEALATLPAAWRTQVGLLQNELLPRSWEAHGIVEPTVAVVWFEKKPTSAVKEIIPSPVAGPQAGLVVDALQAVGIGAYQLSSRQELEDALLAKNLYILTANLAGLDTRGTVADLWQNHRDLAEAVASDVADIQAALLGRSFDRDEAVRVMVRAFEADPEHGTMGRSAPGRLRRALRHADEFGIEAPTLRSLGARHLD